MWVFRRPVQSTTIFSPCRWVALSAQDIRRIPVCVLCDTKILDPFGSLFSRNEADWSRVSLLKPKQFVGTISFLQPQAKGWVFHPTWMGFIFFKLRPLPACKITIHVNFKPLVCNPLHGLGLCVVEVVVFKQKTNRFRVYLHYYSCRYIVVQVVRRTSSTCAKMII